MPAKKWERSMSWLTLPKKIQKLHKENLYSIWKDMEVYQIKDFKIPLTYIRELGFCWEIDLDNSNVEFLPDYTGALVHETSKEWHAYRFEATMPWFPPLPVFSVNIFSDHNSKTLKTDWNITFYGAYFRFEELLKDQVPMACYFYNKVVRNSWIDSFALFRRCQVDIALDFKNLPVDQKWMTDYIKPHKNSNQVVRPMNFQRDLGGYQSLKYGASIKRGIKIKIYNKMLDAEKKHKQAWFPDFDLQKDILTRIELSYFTPFAENDDNTIVKSANSAILWDWEHHITNIMWTPRSQYSPLSAHTYFTRYSKNHWMPISTVISDVLYIQSKKDNF